LLSLCGHNIEGSFRAGPFFYFKGQITSQGKSRIGVGNVIACNEVRLKDARIGHFNVLSGNLNLLLKSDALIGNFNKIKRGRVFKKEVPSTLIMSDWSQITGHHYLDLACNISLGANVVVGGRSSQFWTHGFCHLDKGKLRVMVMGDIEIGEGCYVGSACLFNPGVKIADEVNIGAGAIISKDINEQGLVTAAPLVSRMLSLETFCEKYAISEEELRQKLRVTK
tara:strand:- start:2897 stop:3568 length:672 start_codon:yes stop_codon:yes gene_type:complete